MDCDTQSLSPSLALCANRGVALESRASLLQLYGEARESRHSRPRMSEASDLAGPLGVWWNAALDRPRATEAQGAPQAAQSDGETLGGGIQRDASTEAAPPTGRRTAWDGDAASSVADAGMIPSNGRPSATRRRRSPRTVPNGESLSPSSSPERCASWSSTLEGCHQVGT